MEMNTLEDLYKEIGIEALGHAADLAGKMLVYAEVEDGVISVDIFYFNGAGEVRYRYGSEFLQELIHSLWEQYKASMQGGEWRVLCYVIDGGKFKIDLIYPDQINKNEVISDRRPRALEKYFGAAKVDYSKPR